MIYNWRMVYTGLYGVWIVCSLIYGWFTALSLKQYKLFVMEQIHLSMEDLEYTPMLGNLHWLMGENLWIYNVTEGITSP